MEKISRVFFKGGKTHERILNYLKEKYFTNPEYNYHLLQYFITCGVITS